MNLTQMTIIATTGGRNPVGERSSHHGQQRVWNAVLGCNLKNDRMISVCFQGRLFNITVIQVYAPTSNTEEAEVEWFYEDLQDRLELTPPKDVLFIIGDWNAKVESQEIPGATGKIWPWTEWSRAKANRVLPREHTDHSKHPLPTAQEKTLHRHHQMVDTEIRLILFFAAKDGEALYGQQNKTGSWLWLRSWTPYCQIQTSIEESRENHLTIQVWKWKWSRSVVSNSLRPRGL